MTRKAASAGLSFRPHFKTHQSRAIGRWFREAGVESIAVSSVKMARYFAEDGWYDITIAFPANPNDSRNLDEVARMTRLGCLVESARVAAALDRSLRAPVGVFIKIDTGYGRTGIRFDDRDAIDATVEAIDRADRLELRGFLAHAGHSYQASSIDEIVEINDQTVGRLAAVKSTSRRPEELVASLGDTPCCSVATDFGAADEMRPGNFVFNDMQQVSLGSCAPHDVAVAMACPVVAIHRRASEMIVNCGAVHLSKDTYPSKTNGRSFGRLVLLDGLSRSRPVEGAEVISVSQEHGKVRVPGAILDRLSEGDLVGVLPAHSCLTANLARGYVSIEGRALDHLEGLERRPG